MFFTASTCSICTITAISSFARFMYESKSRSKRWPRVMPTLLNPAGGYLHRPTASFASCALFTSGTMIPVAPMSSAFLMFASSFHGTRTTQGMWLSTAVRISSALRASIGECSRSTNSQS